MLGTLYHSCAGSTPYCVLVDVVSFLVHIVFDEDSWIRVRKNQHPHLCDSTISLPLVIHIVAAVKELGRYCSAYLFGVHSNYCVWGLIYYCPFV